LKVNFSGFVVVVLIKAEQPFYYWPTVSMHGRSKPKAQDKGLYEIHSSTHFSRLLT